MANQQNQNPNPNQNQSNQQANQQSGNQNQRSTGMNNPGQRSGKIDDKSATGSGSKVDSFRQQDE